MALDVRVLEPGDVLFLAGMEGDEAYLIKSGRVMIYDIVGGKEKPIAVHEAGDIVGEIALIDGQVRSACARAMDESELIVLTRELLDYELQKSPPLIRKLVDSYLTAIRNANAP